MKLTYSKSGSWFLLLAFTLIASSCSVTKKNGMYQTRKYRPGKQTVVKLKSKNSKSKTKHNSKAAPGPDLEMRAPLVAFHVNHKSDSKPVAHQVSIPTQSNKTALRLARNMVLSLPSDTSNKDSCDFIQMKNGTEIFGVVTEIGPDQITYKNCDRLNGPNVVLNRSDVLFIKYPDGTKEMITSETPVKEVQKSKNSNAGIGVVLIIIGVVILLFTSILLGLVITVLGIVIISRG